MSVHPVPLPRKLEGDTANCGTHWHCARSQYRSDCWQSPWFMRWKRVIRMQKEKHEISIYYLMCTGHCIEQPMTPVGRYIWGTTPLKAATRMIPDRGTATVSTNNTAQTQLKTRVNTRTRQDSGDSLYSGYNELFFHPTLEKAPFVCALFLRQRLIQKI